MTLSELELECIEAAKYGEYAPCSASQCAALVKAAKALQAIAEDDDEEFVTPRQIIRDTARAALSALRDAGIEV